MNFFRIENIALQIAGYPISYIELIGTLAGLISVYYASRANILTWPTGIVNEVALFILFFQVQLYADMFLQVYFFIVTIFGWRTWGKNKRDVPVAATGVQGIKWLIGLMIAGTIGVGVTMQHIHTWLPGYFPLPASYPFADSFVMVASIAATYLLAKKRVENWHLWILVDLVSSVLYIIKGVYFLSAEYIVFLGMATWGLYQWKKAELCVRHLYLENSCPFHKGHAAMIDFAVSTCDHLTVLICCSSLESIPAFLREKWLADTYRERPGIEVRIFEYDEALLPSTSVTSRDVSRVWAAAFKDLLPDCTSLITSEDYGPIVAEYMGIGHIPFDPGRQRFPVSATQIRKDVQGNWLYLPDSVKEDYSTRVVILGTESTGKTTLTHRLARHFNCSSVMEAGRELIADSNSFSLDDLYKVAAKHAEDIAKASRGGSPLVIIDTDIHITLSYAQFTFGRLPDLTPEIYRRNAASLYLYLNNDVEYVQDGTRLSEQERDLLDASHRKILYDHRIEFEEITGNWETRFEKAVTLINDLIGRPSDGYPRNSSL